MALNKRRTTHLPGQVIGFKTKRRNWPRARIMTSSFISLGKRVLNLQELGNDRNFDTRTCAPQGKDAWVKSG